MAFENAIPGFLVNESTMGLVEQVAGDEWLKR
jgi:hypothetical protein